MMGAGRRDILVGGLTLFGSLATRRLYALDALDVSKMRRAAVIVGIDSYPHLPHLRAAVSGAKEMAVFLRGEGFDTRVFTDQDGPVRGSDLFNAVAGFVDDAAGLDQLVIYFSGHGFLSGTTEFWMLSNAPYDTAEAVSVLESAELAYQSNIPNVVIISDACRSTPSDLGTSQVTGRKIFPAGRTPDRRTDVDIFFATRPGASSYELPVSQSVQQYEGIYTAAFLKAFSQPTNDMVYRFDNGVTVIPNRNMRDFLFREVIERAQAHGINVTQYPEARITSDVPTFVGQLHERDAGVDPTPAGPEPSDITVPDAIQKRVQDVLAGARPVGELFVAPADEISAAKRQAGELVFQSVYFQRRDVEVEGTAFVVYGARVAQVGAWQIDTGRVDQVSDADIWRVYMPENLQAAHVAVLFDDGRGTVLPVFKDFGTHVTVGQQGVIDLRFNPARSSFLFSEYLDRLDQLAFLRGLAAEAARQGALVFDGSREKREAAASRFAGRVRMGKGFDPTLGIYAAYAYATGFMEDGVRSVHDIMLESLGAEIFDVALLARRLDGEGRSVRGAPIVPPFPLMRQGWEYLRVRGVAMSPLMKIVRSTLYNSLWTTYGEDTAKTVTNLVASTPPGSLP
ncbi:MAG: caspase family protein [Allorhizobium sp.]